MFDGFRQLQPVGRDVQPCSFIELPSDVLRIYAALLRSFAAYLRRGFAPNKHASSAASGQAILAPPRRGELFHPDELSVAPRLSWLMELVATRDPSKTIKTYEAKVFTLATKELYQVQAKWMGPRKSRVG
ncbi:hypothetical protein N2603_32990 [Bradyrhizobium huanghuaihaiense]|uniref:hypothetical protein n=1 Tax=Bradyrhizobium huanghuaihaiense TaxID=990078 RepID=UPI0021AA18DC|nr:hypothetical protein [Bradyrhizobium sp. CB3035]UWU74830.1 hypothetical protein N2603_32990 [Bradyrhizobium sp. CB3035]